MTKDKRRKFTDEFILGLKPPLEKLERIWDSKSNLLIRNYKTGGKIFWSRHWLQGQTVYYNIGKFNINTLKVSDAREEARSIQVNYIDKGFDPRLEKKKAKLENLRKQVLEMKKMMFKGLIEKFIEAELPRVETTGNLTCRSAIKLSYSLIGAKRVAKLKFFDDEKGNGNIRRKDENLRSWEDFWTINAKETSDYCIYDSTLGMQYLEDLKHAKIKSYINKHNTIDTRRHTKNVISSCITWGINNEYFGDDPPTNPCFNMSIGTKKSREKTQRKIRTYTPEELQNIWKACDKLIDKYPFQTSLIKLLSVTSLRKEEALKLKWSFIKDKDSLIEIPEEVTKIRINQDIDINSTIQLILNELKALQEKHPWSKFLPWLFPSIRIRNKNMLGGRPYYSKRFPHSSRLKDCKNAWHDVKLETGITGQMKDFKKTHHNIAKELIKDPYELINITRHTNTQILEKAYLKQDLDKRKLHSQKIDEQYNKILKLVKDVS
jgi:integrase|tara:strand:- start:866 stop:2338 length:1473 start_codon:yes stop_codon:yes gene_type:complete